MKKILTLAVIGFSMAASAAQINWGAAGLLYDGTTAMSKNNGYSTTAYLVYLGKAEDDAKFGDIDFSTLATDALKTKTAADVGTVLPTSNPNHIFTVGSKISESMEDTYTYGSSVFGIVYVAKNPTKWGDDDSYYYTTGPFTLVNSGSTYTAATETTAFSQAIPSGSSWTKVPTVPEPSTAALALAGLALLLKRRKA